MPIETEIQPFFQWLPSSFLYWLIAVASLAVAGIVFGWLVCALRRGPIVAVAETGRAIGTGVTDLLRTSPRRVWALGWLVLRESIRRPYLFVVFALFLLFLLYAGWFQPAEVREPVRYYVDSVLSTSGFLVLLLVLLLSALSLPGDIKSKTLHTVVTKPVYPSEVVLGRMLGFAATGTLLLVVMGLSSYVFVVRLLSHTHEVAVAELQVEQAANGQGSILTGRSSKALGHRHDVFVDASGNARLEPAQGHVHDVTVEGSGETAVYRVGPPRGQFVARVPVYGKLRFVDPNGKPTEKGVNTGDEWQYRGFIQGGTLAAAIWEFQGITEQRFPAAQFPHGLPLETTIEVFRTHKGKTDDPEGIPGITGTLAVRNPDTGLSATVSVFQAKEFTTDVFYVRRELQTSDGRMVDLFDELVADGRLEVWLQCAEPMQYFGMAQPDAYFRAGDASFALNFAKGYLGIWLQMLLVIGLGVTFSTFLSGPIALLATAGMALAGLVWGFISDLVMGEIPGGGPVESLVRLLRQQNVTSEMEPGLQTTVIKMLDTVATFLLWLVTAVMPAFKRFDFGDFVAYGYDVSTDLALQSACRGMAFLLPVFVAGYFCLKLREIAR